MARLVLLASLCGLLAACASSPEQVHAAMSDAIGCMEAKAPQLDDHISDATAVAYGLVAACTQQITNSEEVAGQGMLIEAYDNKFKPGADAAMLKLATEIVLAERQR